MKIKLKYMQQRGEIRLENSVDIKEVMINEDFLHPEEESIAIGFRNQASSGIIEFSANEFDKLARTIKKKSHLIKGVKVFRDEKE